MVWLYSRIAQYGVYIAAAAILILASFASGYIHGKKHVQVEWDAEKAKIAIASAEAIFKRNAENEAIRKSNEQEVAKVRESYEKAMHNKRPPVSTGLRINYPANSNTSSMSTGTPPPCGVVDSGIGLRLPESVEQGLRQIADDANNCAIKLRALQEWEKSNAP